jgi:hypothetical protein
MKLSPQIQDRLEKLLVDQQAAFDRISHAQERPEVADALRALAYSAELIQAYAAGAARAFDGPS